jgi:hypothetical protein
MGTTLRANLLTVLLICAGAQASSAEDKIVFQRTAYNQAVGGGGENINSVGIVLAVNEPGADIGDGITPRLFDHFFWSNKDQGAVASVDAFNDPDFAHVTDIFTNGTNDYAVWVGVVWYPGDGFTGGGMHESEFFFNESEGTTANDLHGYQINRIQLALDQFSIASPGSDPNGDGKWTDVSATLTFTFCGVPVPEPSTFALLAIGAVGICLHRARHKLGWRAAVRTW